MPDVVGIRFKKCGKIYDFEIDEARPAFGHLVVIESNFGVTIGTVAVETHTIENPERELKKILRLATDEDLKQRESNESVRVEARAYCIERVTARELQMKLIDIEVTLDRKRILFYFTANGRIDFRELVKDLASRFKTRIEMRQIGVRDEAKLIGGLGICGKEVCCRTFLSDFAPISIKMARNQEIALNPGKLSGLCGRLMCCIGFETLESSSILPLKDEDIIIITEQDAQLGTVVGDIPIIISKEKPAQGSANTKSNIYRKPAPVQKWKKIPLTDSDQEPVNNADIPKPALKETSKDDQRYKNRYAQKDKIEKKSTDTILMTDIIPETTEEPKTPPATAKKRFRRKRRKV